MNKSPHEQIKFGFTKDPKFSDNHVSEAPRESEAPGEKITKPKKKLEIVAQEFLANDVDEHYETFKRVFKYEKGQKFKDVNIKKVVLDMLNDFSDDSYSSEEYNSISQEDNKDIRSLKDLEFSIKWLFNDLKKEIEEGAIMNNIDDYKKETSNKKEEMGIRD